MCVGADVQLLVMGHLRFDGSLTELGFWGVPLTEFCVVGVINVLNMQDGLDGLAGGITLISPIAVGIATARAGQLQEASVLYVFAAAVGGFLLLKWRTPSRTQAHVFMGDVGSLFVGFVLA